MARRVRTRHALHMRARGGAGQGRGLLAGSCRDSRNVVRQVPARASIMEAVAAQPREAHRRGRRQPRWRRSPPPGAAPAGTRASPRAPRSSLRRGPAPEPWRAPRGCRPRPTWTACSAGGPRPAARPAPPRGRRRAGAATPAAPRPPRRLRRPPPAPRPARWPWPSRPPGRLRPPGGPQGRSRRPLPRPPGRPANPGLPGRSPRNRLPSACRFLCSRGISTPPALASEPSAAARRKRCSGPARSRQRRAA
mmetsp:Transcript_78454/g.242128  ORF Transcript_78454/g.242128 Transcript_78454/m.242128 type:complete len:250 (-) Transcript_78454:504-1253(-)